MITTKFEINVTDKRYNPLVAVDLAMKHSCPAIVTLPELVAPFIAARSMRKAMFKTILLIDAPNDFAMLKLRDLGKDAMAADGFDIVITPRRKAIDCLNEVKSLTEFINQQNPLAEIRWSISASTNLETDFVNHLKALHKYPCSMVRTDHRVHNKTTVKQQLEIVNTIRKHVACPIKISGVDLETYLAFESDKSVRFDVTADQFNTILKSVNEQKYEQEKEAPKVDEKALGENVK